MQDFLWQKPIEYFSFSAILHAKKHYACGKESIQCFLFPMFSVPPICLSLCVYGV